VEELVWRVLGCGGGGGGGGGGYASDASGGGGGGGGGAGSREAAEAEAAELAAAAAAEGPPAVPGLFALLGSPAGALLEKSAAVAAAAARARAVGANRAAAEAAIAAAAAPPVPPQWSALPASVAEALGAQLVPALVTWASRLGLLWGRTLPGWLGALGDALGAPPAGAAPPQGAKRPHLSEAAAGRAAAVLSVLGAAGPSLWAAAMEEGCTIAVAAPGTGAGGMGSPPPGVASGGGGSGSGGGSSGSGAPAPDGAVAAALAAAPASPPPAALPPNPSTDFIYELFDFSSQIGLRDFPPELPLPAFLRGGAVHFPAGVDAASYGGALLPRGVRGARVAAALLRGTAAVRRRANKPLNPAALTPGEAVWAHVEDGRVAVSWPALRYLSRSLFPALLRLAAGVARSSAGGRAVGDAFGGALGALACAFGPEFATLAVRPLFSRGLGLPVELPPPAPRAEGPGLAGRTPSLQLLSQALLGVPVRLEEAKAAAMAAASGVFGGGAPLNWASAGPGGRDWPLVLPELAWLSRDAPENPANWGKPPPPPPPPPGKPTAPGIPPAVAARLGGAWNAEALLPLLGSALLGSGALGSRELLEATARSIFTLVASGKEGWGGRGQQLLEDACVRAAGGREPHGAAALGVLLNDVLARLALAEEAPMRLCVLGALRALIPRLTPPLLLDPFLPTLKRLAGAKEAPVVNAAARTLAAVFSSGAAGASGRAQETLSGEVSALLVRGPKDVILEVLRAFLRAVPTAPPPLRDGFILDRLLEVNERVTASAAAGAAAMRDICKELRVDLAAQDVHSAAAAAVRASRAAAIVGNAPWPKCKPEDLEETAMTLCEAFRAYGSVMLPYEVKALLREACTKLMQPDLGVLELSFREVMAAEFSALFRGPVEAAPVDAPGGGYGEEHPHHTHGGGDHLAHAVPEGVDHSLASEWAAARGEGIMPVSFHEISAQQRAAAAHHHGSGEELADAAGKMMSQWGSALKSGMKAMAGAGRTLAQATTPHKEKEGGGARGGEEGGAGAAGAGAGAARRGSGSGGSAPAGGARGSGGSSSDAPVPTMSLASFGAPAPHSGGGGGGGGGGDVPTMSLSSFGLQQPAAQAAGQPAVPSMSLSSFGGAAAPLTERPLPHPPPHPEGKPPGKPPTQPPPGAQAGNKMFSGAGKMFSKLLE
jgi:hypothetical protein